MPSSVTTLYAEWAAPDIATVAAAKTAAENAAYTATTQTATDTESKANTYVQGIATTAVNNSGVTVTVNKVSYTAPVTGTSADLGEFQAAKAALGSRPALDYKVQNVDAQGKKTPVNVDFGKSPVMVMIPYTLGNNEIAGNVQAVYIDGKGAVSAITGSSYDTNTKMLLFPASHFSIYGVGYKQDAPQFTDITNHWAKDDIAFVTARGLLNGKVNDAEGGKIHADGGRDYGQERQPLRPHRYRDKSRGQRVFHRYVELVIDPATAQGLDVNDSGLAMMYESGKLVKSASRTAGGVTYSFNANGEAALPDTKKTGA